MKMSKASRAKYLVLIKELSSGEVIDERIIIHFDPRAWAKFEDRVSLDAMEDLPRLKYSHSVTWGMESLPVQFLKVRVRPEDKDIDCEIRSIDTHFEVCLCNGNLECIEKYAELLVKEMGKYVLAAGTWRLLCDAPSPKEMSSRPRFQ